MRRGFSNGMKRGEPVPGLLHCLHEHMVFHKVIFYFKTVNTTLTVYSKESVQPLLPTTTTELNFILNDHPTTEEPCPSNLCRFSSIEIAMFCLYTYVMLQNVP